MFIVVSYDSPNDKRRLKFMKTLLDFGERVQYSVFECDLEDYQLARLKQRLERIVNPKEDDVRFYALCEICVSKREILGKPLPLSQRRVRIVGGR